MGEHPDVYVERVGNIHVHSLLSDGTGTHREIADAAAAAGLDYVIVTDHNAYARDRQGWYGTVLLLVGEEVHDPAHPHVNHLLVLNAKGDLAGLGSQTQTLVDEIRRRRGLSFIAHPVEKSGAMSGEPEIDWVAWDVRGYTGIELWNYMSEFKSHVSDAMHALAYALAPRLAITGPYPETLGRWDALLARGPCCGICGSDAHARVYRLGPISRRVFSYDHLFRQVNAHTLVRGDWCSDPDQDAALLYEALAAGRAFVGYDGLAPTRGFAFVAEDDRGWHAMGSTARAGDNTRLVVRTPEPALLRLLCDGALVAEAGGRELVFANPAPGVYRVEVLRRYAARWRYWILSNPIWVEANRANCRMVA